MLELVDEAVLHGELPQVPAVGTLLVEDLGDVGGLDRSGIYTHGDALVVDFLLVHPGREEDVEGRIGETVGVVLEERLQLLLLHQLSIYSCNPSRIINTTIIHKEGK